MLSLTHVLMIAVVLVCASKLSAFDLVKEGQPAATIVLPARTLADQFKEQTLAQAETAYRKDHADADDAAIKAYLAKWSNWADGELKRTGDEEKTAAEELQAIVKAISGATLPIVRPAEGEALPAGSVILVGPQLAMSAGLNDRLSKLHEEGLMIAAKDQQLILAGKAGRGTLYAVYHLLESFGCRWVMPGPFGEIYPSTKSLSTTLDIDSNPDHVDRYFWCTYGYAPDFPRWTLRNKGDMVRALGEPTVRQGHALGGPLRSKAMLDKYGVKKVQPVREAKKGPDGKPVKGEDGKPVFEMVDKEVMVMPDEYCAQVEGKASHQIPNFSNPKAWDLYAEFYGQQFNDNPWEKYVSLSAEDGLVIDEHPASVKLRSNELDWMMGAMTATDQLWFFHKRVIDKLAPKFPDKKFGVLVYANNMSPPRVERVLPQMSLVFAPLGVCPLHHVRDDKCKTNRTYRLWLEDWMALKRAAGAEAYYYDYEPMGYCWNMAMICPRWGIIGKNYPWFHEMGLDGHNTQGYDDWAASGLNNYLMLRLYWNVKEDYHAIIADYAKARFGAAADAMIAYYNVLESRMDEIPDMYSNEMWANHLILTPEVRARCRSLVEQAVKAADSDRAKAHVQTMVDVQACTDAYCNALEHMRTTGDYAAAAKMMEPVFAIRDKLNAIYPNYMHPKRFEEKSKAWFMTGGEYNMFTEIAATIQGAAASMPLPQMWQGGLDTRNRAVANGWHLPATSTQGMEEMDVTVCPDVKYKTQREPAAYFYRTTVDVPATFAGKKVSLFYPGLIAKALEIWVNGEPVTFEQDGYTDTVWRGPNYFWMDYDHRLKVDLGSRIKPGAHNTIAFRVFKSFDFGGSYRRVVLLAE